MAILNEKVEEMKFDAFCNVRGWKYLDLHLNPKNPKQRLAVCVDEEGMNRTFLIAESGYYYECLPGKRAIFTPYVLEKEGSS